jgi:hypothetical protein
MAMNWWDECWGDKLYLYAKTCIWKGHSRDKQELFGSRKILDKPKSSDKKTSATDTQAMATAATTVAPAEPSSLSGAAASSSSAVVAPGTAAVGDIEMHDAAADVGTKSAGLQDGQAITSRLIKKVPLCFVLRTTPTLSLRSRSAAPPPPPGPGTQREKTADFKHAVHKPGCRYTGRS